MILMLLQMQQPMAARSGLIFNLPENKNFNRFLLQSIKQNLCICVLVKTHTYKIGKSFTLMLKQFSFTKMGTN